MLALFALRLSGVRRQGWWRQPAVGFAVLLCLFSVWYYRRTDPLVRRAALYHTVFAEMLPASPDPARDLAALGLDPDLSAVFRKERSRPARHDPRARVPEGVLRSCRVRRDRRVLRRQARATARTALARGASRRPPPEAAPAGQLREDGAGLSALPHDRPPRRVERPAAAARAGRPGLAGPASRRQFRGLGRRLAPLLGPATSLPRGDDGPRRSSRSWSSSSARSPTGSPTPLDTCSFSTPSATCSSPPT